MLTIQGSGTTVVPFVDRAEDDPHEWVLHTVPEVVQGDRQGQGYPASEESVVFRRVLVHPDQVLLQVVEVRPAVRDPVAR